MIHKQTGVYESIGGAGLVLIRVFIFEHHTNNRIIQDKLNINLKIKKKIQLIQLITIII